MGAVTEVGPNAPQHMKALAYGNVIRLDRAQIKRDVFAGKRTAADVIVANALATKTMTLGELLSSQRRWGRTRARKFLSRLAVMENRTVGALTMRQRRLLVEELDSVTSFGRTGEPLG